MSLSKEDEKRIEEIRLWIAPHKVIEGLSGDLKFLLAKLDEAHEALRKIAGKEFEWGMNCQHIARKALGEE